MTIKPIFNIHPTVYILCLFAILTASFKELIMIMSLIIIHEFGHFLSAILLKEEVKNITIYPIGGITKINMDINENFWKEWIILIMGPIFQNFAYILLIIVFPSQKDIILAYHLGILSFNLLPIYPLDGGRLIKLGMEMFLPYKYSFHGIIWISYSMILLLFIVENNIKLNRIAMILTLIIIVRTEQKKEKFYYEKLLLEKYLKRISCPKRAIIYSEKQFYRRRKHLLKEKNHYISEQEYLWKKYRNLRKSY